MTSKTTQGGYVLVPREPTLEMVISVRQCAMPQPDMHGRFNTIDREQLAEDIYKAMLAAAPAVDGWPDTLPCVRRKMHQPPPSHLSSRLSAQGVRRRNDG